MIDLMNEWGARWVPWFLSALVQNTIFLMLVFAALRLLRSASARVRTAVATVGVIKLVVPPLVPWHWFGSQTAGGAGETAATLLFPFADTAAGQSAPWGGGGGLTGGLYPVTILMAIWFVVAISRLGWSILQTIDLRRSVRGAEAVPATETPGFIMDRGLRVYLSSRISMPLTIGPWPRRIFVPAVWNDWSPAMRTAVLQHEIAHVLRRDGLVQLAETLAQSVFFFHPLVSLLIRRLRTWREMACDDHSVGGDPAVRLAYSRFLVELAETALGPRPAIESASTLARRKCELMNRVTYQVKEGPMKHVSKFKLTTVLIVLLAAVVPLSLVYGDAPPKPPIVQKAEPATAVATPAPPTVTQGEPSPPAAAETVEPASSKAPPKAEKIKAGEQDKQTDKQKQKEKELKSQQQAAAGDPPPPAKYLKLTLTDEGIFVNGEPMKQKHVEKNLQKAKQMDLIVAIASKGDVSMKQVYDLQNMLREAGLEKVKYTGDIGKAVPMILPPKEAQKKLEALPADYVMHVKVDPEGVLTVDGKKTMGAHLTDVVKKALYQTPELVVALHTENETTYGAFVQVLQALTEGGAKRIAVQDPGV